MTRDDVGFEFMLNALRLDDGVPSSLFAERTGLSAGAGRARARRGDAARGLLEADPTTLRPTALGRRFLNDLQALFLRERRARVTARSRSDRTLARRGAPAWARDERDAQTLPTPRSPRRGRAR